MLLTKNQHDINWTNCVLHAIILWSDGITNQNFNFHLNKLTSRWQLNQFFLVEISRSSKLLGKPYELTGWKYEPTNTT